MDGLGIKAKTLDFLMNWFISVVDAKSVNGWNKWVLIHILSMACHAPPFKKAKEQG